MGCDSYFGPIAGALLILALPATVSHGQSERERIALVPQNGHGGFIESVCMTADPRYLVTAGWDGTVRLWHFETGAELGRLLDVRGGATAVALAACSPAEAKVVMFDPFRKTLILYDLATRRVVWTRETYALFDRRSLAFSSDGRVIFHAHGYADTERTEKVSISLRRTDSADETKLSIESAASAGGGHSAVAAMAPDGGKAAIGFDGEMTTGSIAVVDLALGKKIRDLEGPKSGIRTLAFARDGASVVACGQDSGLYVWKVSDSKPIRVVASSAEFECEAASFLPDDTVATFSRDQTTGRDAPEIRVYDVTTGSVVHTIPQVSGWYARPVFTLSPDGKYLLAKVGDKAVNIHDLKTGAVRGIGDAKAPGRVWSLQLSKDDTRLMVRHDRDSRSSVLDLRTGRPIFQAQDDWGLTMSPDGRHYASIKNWVDIDDGKISEAVPWGHPRAFSRDGRVLVDSNLRVWDVATKRELHRIRTGLRRRLKDLPDSDLDFDVAALSPDASQVAAATVNENADGSYDMSVRIWRIEDGKLIARIPHTEGWVNSLQFTGDGKRLLVCGHGAAFWDITSVTAVTVFLAPNHSGMRAAVLTESERWVATANDDGSLTLWDAASGQQIRRLSAHTGSAERVVVAEKAGVIISGGSDGELKFWSLTEGNEILSYYIFGKDDWAVVDVEGRFDAATPDTKGLYWSVDNEPIELSQLKTRFFEPGLFGKHVKTNPEPLSDVPQFRRPELYPRVELDRSSADKIVIRLSDRGGGIGRVAVSINGKEVTSDARSLPANSRRRIRDGRLTLEVDLSGDSRVELGGKNEIVVRAFNSEGYLASRGQLLEFTTSGSATKSEPNLWVIAVGVSDYVGKEIDLRYAANDAQAIAEALRLGGVRLFGEAKTRVTVLSSAAADMDKQPTKKNIVAALRKAQNSNPADIVILYFSGHGLTREDRDRDFYYLSRDARSGDLSDPAVREEYAISGSELTELTKRYPAKKTVLILDTCASGRAMEKLFAPRDVPPGQILALDRLKDSTGFHVLAGSAADSVSYEATRFRQGLLTYSLLEGLRGASLKDEEYVDVQLLFQYAADRVPELARGVGGIQKPLQSGRPGNSFVIGQLTRDDRAAIPLETAKPVFIRSRFNDEFSLLDDDLSLSSTLNERLLAFTQQGKDVVYFPVDDYPEAYRLVGTYQQEGDNVKLRVLVYKGSTLKEEFRSVFTRADLQRQIAELVDRAVGVAGVQ